MSKVEDEINASKIRDNDKSNAKVNPLIRSKVIFRVIMDGASFVMNGNEWEVK